MKKKPAARNKNHNFDFLFTIFYFKSDQKDELYLLQGTFKKDVGECCLLSLEGEKTKNKQKVLL